MPASGTIEFKSTVHAGACTAGDVPAALSAALGELAERLGAAAGKPLASRQRPPGPAKRLN